MATTTSFVKSRGLREMTATLSYTDTTATEIFVLPSGARIVDWVVNVTTAFNDSGTDYLTVGISGDTDSIIDDLSVAAKGRCSITTELVDPGKETTAMTPIYATYTGSNGDSTAGQLELTCLFSLEVDTTL